MDIQATDVGCFEVLRSNPLPKIVFRYVLVQVTLGHHDKFLDYSERVETKVELTSSSSF